MLVPGPLYAGVYGMLLVRLCLMWCCEMLGVYRSKQLFEAYTAAQHRSNGANYSLAQQDDALPLPRCGV